MTKGVNLEVVGEHLEAIVGHVEAFKASGNGAVFKEAIDGIHNILKQHGAHHILHVFHKAAEHLHQVAEFIQNGAEGIVAGLADVREVLDHVRTTAMQVYDTLQEEGYKDAAKEIRGPLKAIHTMHDKVIEIEKTAGKVQDVIEAVQGEGAAAEADPEPLDGAAQEAEGKTEELKDLPGMDDAASNVADAGAEELDGEGFVGEGGDMPTVDAPAPEGAEPKEEVAVLADEVKNVELGEGFNGLNDAPGATGEGSFDPLPPVGEAADLSASVV